MTTAVILFTVIVLVMTVLAFRQKEPTLYMIGVIGWISLTFLLANVEYPAGNTYLRYAVIGFGLSMTLVIAVQVVRSYFNDRPSRMTPREKSNSTQDEHKRKVLDLTRKKPKNPWDEGL